MVLGRPDDMAAAAIKGLLERAGNLDRALVDGVTQSQEPGEDGFPIASGLEIIKELKEYTG